MKISNHLKIKSAVFTFAALMTASVSAYSCTKHDPHHYTISVNDGVTIDPITITEGEEYKGTIKVVESDKKYIGELVSATLDDANDTNITEHCTYTIDSSTNTASLIVPKEYTIADILVEVKLENIPQYTVSVTDGCKLSTTVVDEGKPYEGTIEVVDSTKYLDGLVSVTLGNGTDITQYCTYKPIALYSTASLAIPKEYTTNNILVSVKLEDLTENEYQVTITSKLIDDEGEPIAAKIYLCDTADMSWTETPIYFNRRTTHLLFNICTDQPGTVKPEMYDYTNFLLENVKLGGSSTEIEKLKIGLIPIQPVAYKSFVTVDIDFNGVVPTGDLTADVVYNDKKVTLALNEEAKTTWKLINGDSTIPEQEGPSITYNMRHFCTSRRYSVYVKSLDESTHPSNVKIEHSEYRYVEWDPSSPDPSEYGLFLLGDYPTQDCTITLKCID
ncbi:MAG: hypothetical protein MJ214_04850 [Bacilli bacterium]|nr:hypothetical protein [Bacilli bacterium]